MPRDASAFDLGLLLYATPELCLSYDAPSHD